MQWFDVALTKSPSSDSVRTLFHHLQKQGQGDLPDLSEHSHGKPYMDGLAVECIPDCKVDIADHHLETGQAQGGICLDSCRAGSVVSPYFGYPTSKCKSCTPSLQLSVDFNDARSFCSRENMTIDLNRSRSEPDSISNYELTDSPDDIDSPKSTFLDDASWSPERTQESASCSSKLATEQKPGEDSLRPHSQEEILKQQYIPSDGIATKEDSGYRSPVDFDLTTELAINEKLLNEGFFQAANLDSETSILPCYSDNYIY